MKLEKLSARGPALVVGPMIAAMGVVFGDIGTSPLYAATTTFDAGRFDVSGPSAEYVYGSTATIVYALTLVVTILYVRFLIRADNRGEGGLLALFGLLRRSGLKARTLTTFTIVAMLGAAMFLGDSVITPAISVLSAVEGLEVIQPTLSALVVPIAVVILLGVFAIQRFGTRTIGRLFGPIMLLWFLVLAVTGGASILEDPAVLQALSPHWVVLFFIDQPGTAFFALGAIVLAVTGAEALYADLGHFGRQAITRAWMWVVFPALVLNYLGQASLALRHPQEATASFFGLVPAWGQLPMVILATAATIIASQSVISGTYSVIHQAWRLGLFPPLRVVHTSEKNEGQIYVPAINVLLALAVLAVTIGFRGSAALASAYGIAVTTTISITTIVYLAWSWAHSRRLTPRILAAGAILLVTVAFLVANLPKATSGGWLPLAIGAIIFTVMGSWWIGQQRIRAARRIGELPLSDLESFLTRAKGDLFRVPGDAVFITRNPNIVPVALRTMVTQNHALQKRSILLSWSTIDVPSTVGMKQRINVETFPSGIVRVVAKVGFLEQPRMTELLTEAHTVDKTALVNFASSRATFFISTPVPRYNRRSKMFRWAQVLFLALDRLAPDPVDVIELPRDRTIVLAREALL
ncbi:MULTISPECIES: KUP/HAK/KT family potassium transporter [unclassified Cryobacterium]|uniref:KUP/HAK/KT family potassium transporter n=1 Tax=unclassified Cryobacterium TaxID=2649013 RepID=UPI002AB477A7|nr:MULTISPECIES: KUP/HAK/KT family potassium transporter [unclassified Cryobacterium]MDY7540800.1 KUP/HAK/KT family potassium transporter [Cryobacterium sp. 5B3]MDY7544536.1 KUP/HAK/KT family potassium transporter [Cryobacterium sp. 5B3]MEB0001060.1 KUP/HAK/KT family potassium transporter [Cryobacterium sp. RTS3]MEB0267931.1 KUP/HAK/KT family potassium transporter [Cryobacterium sp. 10I5]MEB0276695.1 KUP/HAK/KT family potassium transporter [Cryobacterium sp. 5B3]